MAAALDNIWIGDLPLDFNDEQLKKVFEGYGNIVACRMLHPRAGGSKAAALVKYQSAEDAQWVVENLNGNMPEGFDEPVKVTYAKSNSVSGGYGKASAGKGSELAQPYSHGAKGGKWEPLGSGGWPGDKGSYHGGKGGAPEGKGANCFQTLMQTLTSSGTLPGIGTKPDDHCVYVKNLPPDTSDLSLYEMFSPFGAITPRGVKAMLKPDGMCTSVGFVDFQDAESAASAVAALHGTPTPEGLTLHLNLKRPKKGGPSKGEGKGHGLPFS